jgi:hypothetical protein
VIVRTVPGGLLLVSQPDHAALAAEILEHWDLDPLAPVWRDTLLYATRQHDNGWLDLDACPTIDGEGRPYDFVGAPDAVRQAIWPRAIRRIERVKPLSGALVAQHALAIFSRYEGHAAWTPFFMEVASARDELLGAHGALTGATREVFDRTYDLLHMADLASLIFCNGWADAHDDRGRRFILLGDTLTIAPDPFRGRIVDLRVRGRMIPDVRYGSSDALRRALKDASDRWLTGVAVTG